MRTLREMVEWKIHWTLGAGACFLNEKITRGNRACGISFLPSLDERKKKLERKFIFHQRARVKKKLQRLIAAKSWRTESHFNSPHSFSTSTAHSPPPSPKIPKIIIAWRFFFSSLFILTSSYCLLKSFSSFSSFLLPLKSTSYSSLSRSHFSPLCHRKKIVVE